jgi:hypothetical protein
LKEGSVNQKEDLDDSLEMAILEYNTDENNRARLEQEKAIT